MEELTQTHEFILSIVREAGTRARASFGSAATTYKESNVPFDVLTDSDTAIDALLKERISAAYPTHSILSEEGDRTLDSSYAWSIDPIDGSSNYARSIPHFAVSVCLIAQGVPVVGAVYNPMTDEIYSFMKGAGAYHNGVRLAASSSRDLAGSTILFTIGSREGNWPWGMALYEKLLNARARVRNFGASGLDICYLAAGRVDAVIYGGVGLLDIAAAVGIATEVGCVIESMDDGASVPLTHAPQRIVAASSASLAASIRAL